MYNCVTINMQYECCRQCTGSDIWAAVTALNFKYRRQELVDLLHTTLLNLKMSTSACTKASVCAKTSVCTKTSVCAKTSVCTKISVCA